MHPKEAENDSVRYAYPADAALTFSGVGHPNPAGSWIVGECAGHSVGQRGIRFAMERTEDLEPSSLPDRTDPEIREEIPPEDMPVKKRQQPGYEPVGIRSGSWMFNPSLTAGTFYDSNVFSSNTAQRSDIAAVIEPTLRAHSLWGRHGVDLKLDAQSTAYSQFSSLNQTNASLKGNGWLDITKDTMLLGSFQIAHLNEGVGTLSSPGNAISPTPYNLMSGDVTLRKEFNRLTTSVGFRTNSYDYGSTRAQDGTVINQDARDGQIYSLHSRIDYAISSTLGWFGGVEGNQRDIRGTPGHSLNSQGVSRTDRYHCRLKQSRHRRIRRRLCPAALRRSLDRHHRWPVLPRAADMASDTPARRAFQCRADRHADFRHQHHRRARQRGSTRP